MVVFQYVYIEANKAALLPLILHMETKERRS